MLCIPVSRRKNIVITREPIRIGLIGCGHISATHVKGYKELGDVFDVVAVCDVDEDLAHRRAAELGVSHIFTDYQALLYTETINAVDLCLPHHLHAPVALHCLEADKHVLVEKPIGTTLVDADKMIEASQRADKVLMVGHNERYDPQYQEMKRLVDEGLLGNIFCVRADHNYDVNIVGKHWLKNKQEAGGGVLIGSGSHRIDLMRWLLGEITEVFCVQSTLADRFEGEICSLVSLRFERGTIGELACCWAVRHAPWYELMWLYGTKGMIHNATEGILSLYSADNSENGTYKSITIPKISSFTAELRHFGESIRNGTLPLTNGLEGRRTLAVILAAYQSAVENRPVIVGGSPSSR